MSDLPDCGLYRTQRSLGDQIPAGRLVYFHNHGDPGPGLYLPESWTLNRARFGSRGVTLPSPEWAAHLEPLPAEGFYRVREEFYCCAKQCRRFEVDLLVQLGYNGGAQPLLFVPEWTTAGMAIPTVGSVIDAAGLAKLAPLKVATSATVAPTEPT